MNKHEFISVIAPLAEYYGRNLTDAAIAVYYAAARDIDLATFEHLAQCHVADPEHGMFFPTLAHLLAQTGSEKDVTRLAGEAFDKFPDIDGTSSFERNQEKKFDTEARRKKYIASQVLRWKNLTPIERIAESVMLPKALRNGAITMLENQSQTKLGGSNG
ncbi:hypothetical protein A3765_28610 [Oleiphilus sp. HI0130]|nr:hypothetical protein A3765_28895 [Oleiphilus sp. HI0130]KZZ72515.1 hypothetical protein A3765_28610 [Oleiphilus sp. HI0130]